MQVVACTSFSISTSGEDRLPPRRAGRSASEGGIRGVRADRDPPSVILGLVSPDATFLADQVGHLVTTKELGPAQGRRVMPVVTNVRIGSAVEQDPGDVDGSAFDRHVERRM